MSLMPKKNANESSVKKKVKTLLDEHQWYWWMPAANGFGQTGISDFNALKNGAFMVVETKFGKNKATPMQVAFLNSIRSCDGFAFLVTDQNVDSLAAFLGAFDRAVAAAAKEEKPTPEDGSMMINAIQALTNY